MPPRRTANTLASDEYEGIHYPQRSSLLSSETHGSLQRGAGCNKSLIWLSCVSHSDGTSCLFGEWRQVFDDLVSILGLSRVSSREKGF